MVTLPERIKLPFPFYMLKMQPTPLGPQRKVQFNLVKLKLNQ